MAMVGAAILGAFSHSAAEKAFRPWWDAIEDHIVYTIVALAIIVAPSSMIFASPLACQYCQYCGWQSEEKAFNQQFVNKYCVHNGLHPFVVWFPHVLLLVGALLVLIDRPFVAILFKSFNVDEMYRLLVLDEPHRTLQDLDRKKNAYEVQSCMYNCGRYYAAFLLRIIVSLAVSGTFFSILVYYYWEYNNYYYYYEYHPNALTDRDFQCYVDGQYYTCTGHPTEFYMIIVLLCAVLLAVYILMNFWNLIWLLFPRMNSLCQVMHWFKLASSGSQSDVMKVLYYNNRDVRLLLSLLSSSSGIALPLRSLALLDPILNKSLMPDLQSIDELQNSDGRRFVRLRFELVKNSLLHYITRMRRYKVTFLLHHPDVPGIFMDFSSVIEFDIPGDLEFYQLNGPATVSTLIGGKIVGSEPVRLNKY